MPDYALEAALDDRRRRAPVATPKLQADFPLTPRDRANIAQMPPNLAQRALANLRKGYQADEATIASRPGERYREGPGVVLGVTGAGAPGTQSQAPFSPGAVAPFVPTPTRSSDDLVNRAIDAKRSSIAQQRSQVAEEIGSTTDKRKAGALSAQLKDLEAQDRSALQERHYNTMASAHQATVDHKQERDIQSANQHIGLLRGLEQISARSPTGTKEHAEAVLNLRAQLAQQYPLGKLPKEGEDLLKAHSATHDDLATQVQRAKDAGFTVTGFKSTKEGDIDVQTKASSEIAAQELKPYGLSPEQLQKPVGVRVGNLAYDASGKATFKGAGDGATVRIDTGTKKGGQVDMPVETYLKHGGILSPEDMTAQTKAGRISATPSAPAVTEAAPAEPARDTRSPHEVVQDAIAAGRIVVADKQQPEKVLVRDKDGKQFRLPRSQLQDATKQGYQLVQ